MSSLFKKDRNKKDKSNKNINKNKQSSSSMKIIGENGAVSYDNKSKIFIILGFVVIIIALIVFAAFLFINKEPGDYDKYQEKKKIYDEVGIKYSYEDYKKDEKAIEKDKENSKNNDEFNGSNNNDNENNNEDVNADDKIEEESSSENSSDDNDSDFSFDSDNDYIVSDDADVSDATKEITDKNQEILDDKKETTFIKTNTNEIASSIISQTKKMNKFIDDHLGYPDNSKEFDSEYDGVRIYNDNMVKTFTKNIDGFEPAFGQSLSEAQAEIRYSICENVRYVNASGFKQYNKCLKNYMKLGHPIINSIDFISLSEISDEDSNELWDSIYFCNLKANIISNGQKYTVYLSSQVEDNGDEYYKIIDVK